MNCILCGRKCPLYINYTICFICKVNWESSEKGHIRPHCKYTQEELDRIVKLKAFL
jgi:hypothetical protein